MKRMMLKLPDALADALAERCGPRERTSYILAAIRLVDLHERLPDAPLGTWTWSDAAANERAFAEGRRRAGIELARIRAGAPDPYEAQPDVDHYPRRLGAAGRAGVDAHETSFATAVTATRRSTRTGGRLLA